MNEEQIGKKLCDMFSDERISPIGIAHYTFEHMGLGAEMRVREWLDEHDTFCRVAAGDASSIQLEFDFDDIPPF